MRGKQIWSLSNNLAIFHPIFESLLIGSLFMNMSRIVKLFNFSHSLLDSIEDEMKLVVNHQFHFVFNRVK